MLFSLGYVYGIVRRRDAWTAELARVNTVMGIVVAVVMLLANSPLLDFRRISLASQVARVESGEIEARALDFSYIERNLARPGYLLLTDPEASGFALTPETRREIAAAVQFAAAANIRLSRDEILERFWRELSFRPEPFDVPQALRPMIEQLVRDPEASAALVRSDLNDDGQDEYVLVQDGGDYISPYWFRLVHGEWQTEEMLVSATSPVTDLRSGPVGIRQPEFRNLEIGGIRLQPVQPD
jgi:hypothetical protein